MCIFISEDVYVCIQRVDVSIFDGVIVRIYISVFLLETPSFGSLVSVYTS
jgi:hypothetical protein